VATAAAELGHDLVQRRLTGADRAQSCAVGFREAENAGSVPPVAEIFASRSERLLLGLYLLLCVAPFVGAALAWHEFWGSVAPFSTLLALAVLFALLRRHRWAWVLLVLLDAFVIVLVPLGSGWRRCSGYGDRPRGASPVASDPELRRRSPSLAAAPDRQLTPLSA
jgi:hypothetical protein